MRRRCSIRRARSSLGNPQGDVTLVEFFDYNCGYCKRALTDMIALMKGPEAEGRAEGISGARPASVEAAQVAVAVRMQDKTGKKYLEFHQKLLTGRGQIDKARALAAAKEIGLDMARLEKDMKSDEMKATLEESIKLAEALGLNGTPSYVIGNDVVIGAVGLATLQQKIKAARCGQSHLLSCPQRTGRPLSTNGRGANLPASPCTRCPL